MIRTLILLLTLTLILLGVGFLIGGVTGMTLALFLAFFLNFFSYWYSDSIILRVYRAHQTEDEGLRDIVRKLASEARIPVPKIYVIPSDVPNAFATGRDPEHGAVAVTQGLTSLGKDEMEAVIAHEMSHIKNRDTLVQTVAATIAGAIAYLAMIGYWSLFMSDRRDGGSLVLGVILIAIFAPLAATLVKLAISRRREYAADHGAALLTKKPMALASALRKITDATQHRKIHGSSATSHLWIVNPLKQDWFTGLFSTHPPMKRRIAKLERLSVSRGDQE